jgi:hypothetical protein
VFNKNKHKKEITKEKNMWRYVFYFGVLKFGFTFGLLEVFWDVIFRHANLLPHIILDISVVPLVIGIPWGISMWYFFKIISKK